MTVSPFAKPGSREAQQEAGASRVEALKAQLQEAVADETSEFIACMASLLALAERTDRTLEAHPGARGLANEVINWLPTRLDAVKAALRRV